MNPNYYKILAVAESATQEEIKKAYRQAAMRCHPDRGGTHEQMLFINEAFGILGNPISRREYDFARRNQADLSAQQAAERSTQTARSQAANYPREWGAFEKWLKSIAADFQRAEYGEDGDFPTAGDSVSGNAFIVIGAAIGGIIGLYIYISRSEKHPLQLVIPCSVGAWIGCLLHGFVKRMITDKKTVGPLSLTTLISALASVILLGIMFLLTAAALYIGPNSPLNVLTGFPLLVLARIAGLAVLGLVVTSLVTGITSFCTGKWAKHDVIGISIAGFLVILIALSMAM